MSAFVSPGDRGAPCWPDGISTCAHCGAGAPYWVGPDGEIYIVGQDHRPKCPDAWPNECPF